MAEWELTKELSDEEQQRKIEIRRSPDGKLYRF